MQLDSRLTVRCTQAEREAWHRWAVAHDANLSTMTRTVLNNLSGVNDPPDFSRYTDDEVQYWKSQTASTLKRRGLTTTTLALVLVAVLFFALDADEAIGACRRYICPHMP